MPSVPSSTILTAVNNHEPALMAKTAQMVALLGRIEADFVPDVLSDFNTIIGVVQEKTAAVNWKPYAMAAGGTVAGGLLSSIATDLYDAAKKGLTKGRNYARIMEANPQLKREVDPKSLRMAYNSLHRFAPDFTSDPLIGGALLKQVAELPQMSHKTIVELIGARKDIQDAKGRHFADIAKHAPLLLSQHETRTETSTGSSETTKRPGI